MIPGSGDWIGSVGPAQSGTAAVASPAIAAQATAADGNGSFADVMRQSTGVPSAPPEAKKPVAKTVATSAGVSVNASQVATKHKGSANELEASVPLAGDVAGEVVDAKTPAKAVADATGAGVAAKAVATAVALPHEAPPVPAKPGDDVVHLTAIVKSNSEEHGKAKAGAAEKPAKSSAVASVATMGGGAVSVPAGGSADVVAAAVAKQTTAVAMDTGTATEDKGQRGKAPQVADGMGISAMPASVTAGDEAAAKSTNHETAGIPVSQEVVSAASPGVLSQGDPARAMTSAIVPMHGAGIVQSGLAVAQGREGTINSAAALSHGQAAGSGELTLSSYDSTKSNQLEVGLQGGEFGWLKVRAELGTNGEVNAYLRGASTSSTDLLQAQAPRIEAYLGASDVAVSSVRVEPAQTMHSYVAPAASSSVVGDGAASSGGGLSQQQQQGSHRGDGSGGGAPAVGGVTSVELQGDDFVPVQVMVNRDATGLTGTGNWLSVRA